MADESGGVILLQIFEMRVIINLMLRYYYISSIIKYLAGLLEIILGARVFLKLLGASSKALIVNLLYKITDFIVAPFKFIFPNVYFDKGMVDFAAVSAMLGYLILVLVVLKFLRLILIKPINSNINKIEGRINNKSAEE